MNIHELPAYWRERESRAHAEYIIDDDGNRIPALDGYDCAATLETAIKLAEGSNQASKMYLGKIERILQGILDRHRSRRHALDVVYDWKPCPCEDCDAARKVLKMVNVEWTDWIAPKEPDEENHA